MNIPSDEYIRQIATDLVTMTNSACVAEKLDIAIRGEIEAYKKFGLIIQSDDLEKIPKN